MNPPMKGSKKDINKEWTVMFEKLEAYKREHNTCNVPKRYANDPKLGHWVHYQRTMCKTKKLSQERKDMLETIGFVWSERKPSSGREQTSWDERFQELKEFYKNNGHCKVPRSGPNAALGRWVKWQRWNRTLLDRGESSVLTKRKIKLLNSLNFSWGYQKVQTSKATPSKPAETEVSIEPLPYMPTETKPSAKESIEPLPFMPTESNTSSIVNHDERQHVVSPPFSTLSFENRLAKSTQDDRSSFFSRLEGSTNTFGQQVKASRFFNRNQANFSRPSMSPFEGDYERFDRQTTAYELNLRIQAYQNRNCMPNNFQGMPRPNEDPMMQASFKVGADQMNFGNHVAVTKCWKCSVCRYASFDTYEEALAHENNCNGYPEGSFCRACAA